MPWKTLIQDNFDSGTINPTKWREIHLEPNAIPIPPRTAPYESVSIVSGQLHCVCDDNRDLDGDGFPDVWSETAFVKSTVFPAGYTQVRVTLDLTVNSLPQVIDALHEYVVLPNTQMGYVFPLVFGARKRSDGKIYWFLNYLKNGTPVYAYASAGPVIGQKYTIQLELNIHSTSGSVALYVDETTPIIADASFNNTGYGGIVDSVETGLWYKSDLWQLITVDIDNFLFEQFEPVITQVIDDFNDGVLDTSVWKILETQVRDPQGNIVPTLRERNGRIEVDTTGRTVDDSNAIQFVRAVDITDLDVTVDAYAPFCDNVRITIGLNEMTEISRGANIYSVWSQKGSAAIYVFKKVDLATGWQRLARTPYGQWNPYSQVRIVIQNGVITFYVNGVFLYSEDCSWLLTATGAVGKISLFAEKGFAVFDNFRFVKASDPAPTMFTVTVQEKIDYNGMITPSNGVYSYPAGTNVSFAATPNSGFLFKQGWLIAGTQYPESQLNVIVSLNGNIIAQDFGFYRDAQYILVRMINTLGGMTNIPSGINAVPVGSGTLTVTATAEQINPPGIIPTFKNWILDGVPQTEPSATITLSGLQQDLTKTYEYTLEATWDAPVPTNTWFLRICDTPTGTPPAIFQANRIPDYETLLAELESKVTNKEFNFVLIRTFWCFDLATDPTGSTPKFFVASLEQTSGEAYGPSFEEVRAAVRLIHQHGFYPAVSINMTWDRKYWNPPANWDYWDTSVALTGFNHLKFIQNYFNNLVLPLAQLCEEEGVELLVEAWEMHGFENAPIWNGLPANMEAWKAGMARVRQVYHGLLTHNVQGNLWGSAVAETVRGLTLLQDVDVIFISLWAQATHLPVDPRDAALDCWFGTQYTRDSTNVNYIMGCSELATLYGKKLYVNCGYPFGHGNILNPSSFDPNSPQDQEEQQLGWRGALEAMRYQPWCAGIDAEDYTWNRALAIRYGNNPDAFVRQSFRYFPENTDAILKELNQTIMSGTTPTNLNLNMTITPVDGGTVIATPSSDTGKYPYGTFVSLEAKANDGYKFDHWVINGNLAGQNLTIPSLPMLEDQFITAYFSKLGGGMNWMYLALAGAAGVVLLIVGSGGKKKRNE